MHLLMSNILKKLPISRLAGARLRLAGLAITFALVLVQLGQDPARATVTSKIDKLMEPCPNHAGEWVSNRIYGQKYWYVYSMHFKQTRPGSTEIRGKMYLLGWSGTVHDSSMPRDCRSGKHKFHVNLAARGKIQGNKIHIEATHILSGRNFCGNTYDPDSYNLDRFTGSIDYKNNTIRARLTDGGRFNNHPAVFKKKPC